MMTARKQSKVNTKYKTKYHLMVDSTGLKIVGEGEWHSHKHKTSNRNRKWRKLHLGIDSQGYSVTSKLTKSNQGDLSVIPYPSALGGDQQRKLAVERIKEVNLNKDHYKAKLISF